jgi:hypothetical protein
VDNFEADKNKKVLLLLMEYGFVLFKYFECFILEKVKMVHYMLWWRELVVGKTD